MNQYVNDYFSSIPQSYTDELMHYGVLGMKWGKRKAESSKYIKNMPDKKAERWAKKDAKKYARAKMFYGEGAGNRRKLIKATVEQRSKNSTYKKAFDKALDNQDMSKHASKARTERRVKDTGEKIKKIGRNPIVKSAAIVATAAAAYGVAHKTGVDRKIAPYMKKYVNTINNMKGSYYNFTF